MTQLIGIDVGYGFVKVTDGQVVTPFQCQEKVIQNQLLA